MPRLGTFGAKIINGRGLSRGFSFIKTIAANTENYNLYNDAVAAGWNQVTPMKAVVTVDTNVYVWSDTTSTAAFATGTGFPAGSTIEIINNGFIMGRGGAGGGYGVSAPLPSVAGGPAMDLGFNVTITNNSIIGGGGGGGGNSQSVISGGGGAGGGEGGGTTSATTSGGTPGNAGSNGTYPFGGGGGRIMSGTGGASRTLTANGTLQTLGGLGGGAGGGGAGAAQTVGSVSPCGIPPGTQGPRTYVSVAGGGGGWGASGGSGRQENGCGNGGGTSGSGGSAGDAGGSGVVTNITPISVAGPNAGAAGGKCVNLNGYAVTWAVNGTRYGAIS